MNLGHVAAFHAVAIEKSVSRGAARLRVSQPAISKQVRQLERRLGTPLFDRHPKGVRLTEAGTILADYAARIFALESEARAAINDLRGLARGRLALGSSTTIGVYLLPEMLVRFRRERPGISVTLEVGASRLIEQRVVSGELDLGLTESFSGDDRLKAENFRFDELVAIAPPGHPLLVPRRVRATQLCAEPFVVHQTESDTKSFAERTLAERGLQVRPVMSLSSTEAVKRAVAAGVGVAIVSRLSLGLELSAKTLGIIRVENLNLRRPLYLLRRPDRHTPSALKAFLDLIGRSGGT